MPKIGFAILHYNVLESTILCVDCIKERIDNDDYTIVVVDNGSKNGTGKELKDMYENDNKVHVILNGANMGFSAGNNVGFRYLKHEVGCDYIVLMNNDIYLDSNNISNVLERDYEEYRFDVLGPKIERHLLGGAIGYDNPVAGTYSKRRLLKEKLNYCIYLALAAVYCEKLFYVLSNIKNSRKIDNSNKFSDNRIIGVPLHGSIWFFSPKYIEKYEGLDEITFMYHEEEILYRKLEKVDGVMIYEPDIKVIHDHTRSSVNSLKNDSRANRITSIKLHLKSVNDLLKAYKKSDKV